MLKNDSGMVTVHIPSSTSANTNVMRAEETYCGTE